MQFEEDSFKKMKLHFLPIWHQKATRSYLMLGSHAPIPGEILAELH